MSDFDDLPSNYSYVTVSSINDRIFCIEEVKDKDSAEEWLNAYQLLSKTTWRVERTYKSTGKFVIFKKDYRCCHFTDRRVKGERSSKHTGCQAKLKIIVKRIIGSDNPCIITMKNSHNHAINSAASLKYRVTEGKVPDTDWFLPLTENISKKSGICIDRVLVSAGAEITSNNIDEVVENEGHSATISQVPISAVPEIEIITNNIDEVVENEDHSATISQIKKIFDRIEKGIQSNSAIFLPAAKKMLKNASRFAATETGLVTAMHTFGSYSGVQTSLKHKYTKNTSRRSHKTIIGVQPTAVARRKYSLAGKKNISAGRPRSEVQSTSALRSHDYTTFGRLPSRKRKAPHDLSKCVFDDKDLGKTTHSKTN